MRHGRPIVLFAVGTCLIAGMLKSAWTADSNLQPAAGVNLDDLLGPHGPLPSGQPAPFVAPKSAHRLAIGINYTGGQLRWMFTPRWAVEGRYQTGSAGSSYGDVKAQVFGVRGYHYYKTSSRFPLYLGAEIAHAEAKADQSDYKTNGVAGGIFGGVQYFVLKNLSIEADLGPYVIALSNDQTNQSQTNLDFILNTALVYHFL
jgi:opacity protein-like surface antigen